MVNFVSEIKKKKNLILPCGSNEDFPRIHNSEENWKLLKNIKIFLHALLSITIQLNYVLLYQHFFSYFFPNFVWIWFPREQTQSMEEHLIDRCKDNL